MTARMATLGLAGALVLGGCANAPSITNTDPWRQVEGETSVSVCYAASATTREEVAALAVSYCPKDRQALRVINEDSFLNNCPLVKRNRVSFLCVPPP